MRDQGRRQAAAAASWLRTEFGKLLECVNARVRAVYFVQNGVHQPPAGVVGYQSPSEKSA